MAAEEREGAARPTASGETWTQLSEFYPYGDAPPRLCAALNDTPTDASPTAEFTKVAKPKPKVAGAKDPPPLASEVDVPLRDVVPAESLLSATTITDVADWVSGRLGTGLGFAWLSQLHAYEQWVTPEMTAEGLWASTMSELFLGLTYSGPSFVYDLGHPLKYGPDFTLVTDVDACTRWGKNTNNPGKKKDGGILKGVPPSAWEPWMYRRFERKRHLFEDDPMQVWSWEHPVVTYEEDADYEREHDNDDPVIPIGTACQHLSTYTVLSRGFTLASMGNQTVGAVGLMASDACWSHPLYCKERVDVAAGKAGAAAAADAGKAPAAPPPAAPPQTEYTDPVSGEHVVPYPGGKHVMPDDAVLKVDKAVELGLGPGTVVVYDPDRGVMDKEKKKILMLNDYELHVHGPDPVRVWGRYMASRATNKGSGVSFGVDWTNASRPSEYVTTLASLDKQRDLVLAKKVQTKADEQRVASLDKQIADTKALEHLDTKTRTAIPWPGERQYDGSHIFAVLRKHPTKPLVQYLDVNQGMNLAELKETNSESLILRQGGAGIVDGAAAHDQIYDMKKAFAGYGILPPHEVDMAQVEHLKRSRPIGIARLALTVRPVDKKGKPRLMTGDDVLYVSRMTRMYGDAPDQNHYVARLLWSLRNSPGFTNVQPWWFIYAPKGLLARCMWAYGARSMTIPQFLARHRPDGDGMLDGDDLSLRIVVSNEGEPPRAGHCSLYCRFKSTPNGAATVVSFEPAPPPGPLMALCDPGRMRIFDKKKRSLNWNQSFVHPKISLDESVLPAIFGVGG